MTSFIENKKTIEMINLFKLKFYLLRSFRHVI